MFRDHCSRRVNIYACSTRLHASGCTAMGSTPHSLRTRRLALTGQIMSLMEAMCGWLSGRARPRCGSKMARWGLKRRGARFPWSNITLVFLLVKHFLYLQYLFFFKCYQVRLKHRDTGSYLASSEGAKFGHPINGQQEICAVKHKDKSSEWQTAEGVFMPSLDGIVDQASGSQDELW